MKEIKENQKQAKKPYARPVLKQIALRPEEAVLGNCKTAGISGPASTGNCAPAGSPCSTQGS